MTSGIRVESLSKRFGAREAVKELSLEAPRGSILGLLGFNGAGKSTTMDILATLASPTSGRAFVAGHDVVKEPLEVRRRMTIVFESAVAARPSWTVEEYLRFFQALRGGGELDVDVMRALELEPLRRQTTGTLSAGQRKRVEIARAMIAKPEVLLLDEPTKEIDMKGKRVVWDAVREEARRGTTVLLSTHDVLEVRELCDRVHVMHEGRLTATLERAQIEDPDIARLESLLVSRMEGRT